MPTRRIMAVTILTVVAATPVFALAKVWASRKLAEPTTNSFTQGAAEIASVIL
jgi:hypothetical protein